MLGSSGFFRSVHCPFFTRGSCQRGYCHFKHDVKPAETVQRPQDHLYKSSDADDSTALAPNALEKQSDQPMLPETLCTVLELEKVSKAIEAVKTEVEQQQHKLLMYKSSLECENHNFVTPATSSEYSFASSSTSMVNFLASTKQNPTAVYECQAQDTPLNSVVYNPTPASSLSLSKLTFNALNEVNEEDTFQYIPMASSKIKNACSVLNKYVIDRCRPCTDLEYDPLVNYSSNLKQNVKKEYMEEKQEFKRMIERSPEKKHTVASKTVRDCQPIKAEISSDDELVIDVPDLPPLTQNPRVHRRFQKKGNYANTSNLSLIRKVRQPRTTDSTNATLDVGKSLDDSVATNLQSENSSRGNEPNSGALQRKPKPDSSESCKSSNLTNGQTNKASRAYDVPKHGFKAKGIDMENSTAHVNVNNVKLSNQKYRKEHVPAKLEVDVQKCEETKEQSLIHLDSFKRSNEKGPQARLESRNESLKVDKCPISTAMKCNVPGTANESKCINNVATGMRSDQQGQKMQKQADHFGNENWDESLQTTREKGEESSLSDEELNSTDSEDLDFSESDPMEECLRIFNESSKQNTVEKNDENIQDPGNAESAILGQKKRIAHVAKFNKGRFSGNRIIVPRTLPMPKQRCHSRIKLVQQQAVQLMANVKSGQAYKATVSDGPGRKRLIVQGLKPQPIGAAKAEMDNVSVSDTLVHYPASWNSFRKGPAACSNSSCNVPIKEWPVTRSISKSACTVLPQGAVCHTPAPQRSNPKRGSKVSSNVRKQYLSFFIEEFLKTCSSRQAAVNKALSEEKAIFERSTSRFMYLNVAVHALKILRNPANLEPKVSDGPYSAKKKRPLSEASLEGAALYRVLKEYVLTEGQLKECGYPRYNPDRPGTALLFNGEAKKYIADSLIQVCCRCGTSFSVTPEGNYISKEECNYHWGRVIKRQVAGGWETRYGCCEGSLGSVGCQVAKLHVYNRKENLEGFVKTFLKLIPLDGNPGVYAVNSEMCYTRQGVGLTRVSVLSANLQVVYDVFVKPDNEVIDYNTRFSGVTREDLMTAKTTLPEVQAALLMMFSADTILIGHSLEKDLLALKLIHSMVIDTSVVFPHRLGLPHKQALRNLMADYLTHDNVEGPGSVEKGRACMELMMWKVKEDAKGRKW